MSVFEDIYLLSVTKQYDLVLDEDCGCSAGGKVTVDLIQSNGSFGACLMHIFIHLTLPLGWVVVTLPSVEAKI